MATRTRSPSQPAAGTQEPGETTPAPSAERAGEGRGRESEGTGERQHNGGRRTATVNLPFMTAQFRAPDMHVPSAGELGGAARSLLPSPAATLYYGGLVVTAALGVIEWPVAAAIGVGTALASRGELDPLPRRGGTSRGARAADERAADEA